MQVQIGVITKLDDGYVLTIHGKNHVARDTKELGKKVASLAGRKIKPTVAESPIQEQNPLENVVPIRREPNWDEQRKLDDRNLSRLIGARLSNQISEEDLMRGAGELVKTYSMEEVAKIVFMAEEQFFQAQQTVKENGLGSKCSCPDCPQNQSYPNERGQCVGCYKGEHLHPRGHDVTTGTNRTDVQVPHDLGGPGVPDDDADDDGNVWPPTTERVFSDDGVRVGSDGGNAGDGDGVPVPTYEQPDADDPGTWGQPNADAH